MPETQRRANGWAVAAVAAVAAAAAWLVYLLRYILLPFVFAAALAYVASPADGVAQSRLRLPHWAAVLLVYVGYVALAAGLGCLIVFSVQRQAEELVQHGRELLRAGIAQVLGGNEAQWMGRKLRAGEIADETIRQVIAWLGTPLNAAEAAFFAFGLLMSVVLTLVLLFYFLYSGDRLARGSLSLVPPRFRPRVQSFAARLKPVLGRYIRGVFAIVAFTVFVSWLAIAWLLHLPNAVLLALVIGLFEMAPVIGPTVAVALAGIVALEQGKVWTVIAFAAYYTGLRIAIDEVLGPLIFGHAVTLHPVVILFVFLVGGALFGLLGLVLAVPVAASVKIVLKALYAEEEEGRQENKKNKQSGPPLQG